MNTPNLHAIRERCEKCGADKICVSYQCCPHPIDWYWLRGFSSATCRLCGGTVNNPEYEEGQKQWMVYIQELEEENKRMREALKPAEQGGIHVSVNLSGVTSPEHFRRVVNEIANDIEIQKEFALSPHP